MADKARTSHTAEPSTASGARPGRIARIFGDVLEVERLHATHHHPTPIPRRVQPLAPLARIAEERLTPAAAARGVRIAIEADEELRVEGDPERLLRVVLNLVANAIDASPERATVAVRIRAAGDRAHLSVTDEGAGVPIAEWPYIFADAWRSPRHRGRGGHDGLGLTLCKAIVDAHRGRIWLESQLGAGTTFHVLLPRFGGAPS